MKPIAVVARMRGASGVDNETFKRIDTHGLERWLETLWEELSSGKYVPKPLLRVWISKSNGANDLSAFQHDGHIAPQAVCVGDDR